MTEALPFKSAKSGNYFFIVFIASLVMFVLSTITTIKFLTIAKIEEVPDLTHRTVESARSLCRVNRLKIAIKEYRFDPKIAANFILAQDPLPNEKVKSGRIIHVVVSRGSRTIPVPAVIGQMLREGTLAIGNAGLKVGRVTRVANDQAPKDQILDQWPGHGHTITADGNVNLLVSTGHRPIWYIMPDLIGYPIDQATNTLEKLNMTLSEIKRKVDNTKPSGTVILQTPSPGSRVREGIPAGLVATTRSDNQNMIARFVTINYHVPAGNRDVRVKMVVRDDNGLRELYNAMESPGTDLVIRKILNGTSAVLRVYINGKFMEERII